MKGFFPVLSLENFLQAIFNASIRLCSCCLLTILITPKGNIHNNPIISFRGLPIYETDEFIFGLEEEIEKTTKTFKLGNKQQEHNLIDALKIACRKFTKEITGKKRLANINLVRI